MAGDAAAQSPFGVATPDCRGWFGVAGPVRLGRFVRRNFTDAHGALADMKDGGRLDPLSSALAMASSMPPAWHGKVIAPKPRIRHGGRFLSAAAGVRRQRDRIVTVGRLSSGPPRVDDLATEWIEIASYARSRFRRLPLVEDWRRPSSPSSSPRSSSTTITPATITITPWRRA
jgi:hypothetical protein